jgi:hypothetical protein
MSPPSASASIERPSGVDDAGAEQRILALAAARLAHEAGAVMQSQAKLVDQVQRTAAAALTRIADGAGTPAEILTDVTREIVVLRDLVSAMQGPDAEAEFFRPDIILDNVVAGASLRAEKRGVAIDYVRSFSNFTMFGARVVLAAFLSRCIDAAAQHCGGGVLSLRANFYDAHDGRRMLRLVISSHRGVYLPAAEMKSLAAAPSAASIIIKDGAMIVMLRAPLAAPARLLAVHADFEAHGA